MGMVAVRNSAIMGLLYYTNMAADAGMIGICGTNARPSIAPTFGVENMLGTNPLSFAMPTDEEFHFSLDCATSVSQRGKIEVYARRNQPVPEGWVIGHDGTSKTDPHQILEELTQGLAALAPLEASLRRQRAIKAMAMPLWWRSYRQHPSEVPSSRPFLASRMARRYRIALPLLHRHRC